MNWITIVWSINAGICFTMAGLHLLVWLKAKETRANILFAAATLGAGLNALAELALMRAQTPEQFGMLLRVQHVSLFVLVVSVVWFVRCYLNAGRLWLAWVVTANRVLTLVLTFSLSPNLNFLEITALERISIWGDTYVVPIGTKNPWTNITTLSAVLLLVFVIDAAISAWRRGERRRALVVAITFTLATTTAVVSSEIMNSGLLALPLTISFPFLFIVIGIAYELGMNLVQSRETEQNLSASEARFRATFEQAAVGIAHVAPDGRFLRLNDRFCDITGYSRNELLEQTFQDITHPDDLDVDVEYVNRLLNGEIKTYSMEKRYVRKAGDLVWVDLTVSLLRDDAGQPSWFVAVIEDITLRKQAEQELHNNRDYLEHLLNSIPDAVFSVKLPERTVEWARDTYGVLGHDPDKYIGKTTEWLYDSPEKYQAFGELIQSAMRGGKNLLITQMDMLNKNGEAVPVEVNATIFYDKGEPVSMIGLIRDITERKYMEENLRQKEELLSKAQGIAHLGSWSWDLATDQLTWSEEMYRIYGIDPMSPLTFQALLDIIHPEDREHHKQLAAELREGTTGSSFRYRILRPNGAVRYIYGTGLVEREENGSPVRISGTIQDVTDIKTVEMAYRGSETRLKEVQKIARIGFWEQDALTNKLSWSDEVFQMLEVNKQEFSASFEIFLSIIHPDDRAMVREQYNESFETHAPYSGTCRIVLPGDRVKYLYRTAKPIVDQDGKLLRTIGILQDITELKEIQNESMHLRLELAHLNRIMTMNELAASLAHEINQPLGAIMNNASAAKLLSSQGGERKEDFEESLDDIAQDALRAGQIINKIRSAMHKGEASYTSLDVNKLLDDVVALYRNSFSLEHISVVQKKDPKLVPINGDLIRLQQVLMNLITNAMDAMVNSPQKRLSLLTAYSENKITVSVSDTGSGIDNLTVDQIFEPFYTTKNEGMGIGLRLCKSIIEEHGGRIWAENNAESGSTFYFTLKASTEGHDHEFA